MVRAPLEWQNIDSGREINCQGVAVILDITISGTTRVVLRLELEYLRRQYFLRSASLVSSVYIGVLLWRYDCVGGR